MDLDQVFRALSDSTRRRLLDELVERDGQTLFELHVRMTTWHGASLTRQGLSKHLAVLEEAGLVRTEWQWRSKHHFVDRRPVRRAWDLWLGGFVKPDLKPEEQSDADRSDERVGG